MSKASELANLIGNINAGGGGVNKNILVNGSMNVAQRGTSSTSVGGSSGYFTCDRWLFGREAGTEQARFTMTQDTASIGIDSLPFQEAGVTSALKMDVTTAESSVAAGESSSIMQRIEGFNCSHYDIKTQPITLSFYAKSDGKTGTMCASLYASSSGKHHVKEYSITTSWQRFVLTFPPDSNATAIANDNSNELQLSFTLTAGSNLQVTADQWASGFDSATSNQINFADSTSNNWYLTGVQLEVGQNATTFEREPFATTLLKCQRYFHAVSGAGHPFPIDSAYARYITHSQDTNGTKWFYEYPVEMRAIPTLELNNISSSTVQHYNYNAGASYNMTGSSLSESGTRHAHISFTFASGISTGNTVSWRWLNNPNASWNFKAEL